MPELNLFNKLNQKKQTAVIRKAEGIKSDAIAIEIGVEPLTVHRWLGLNGKLLSALDEYKAYLAAKSLEKVVDLNKQIIDDSRLAWERLKAIALDPEVSGHVCLNALDSMLDRAGVARQTKTDSTSTSKVIVTEEQRADKFKRLRELQADLLPQQLKVVNA